MTTQISSMSSPSESVVLHLPAILQNPLNRAQKQLEAHNAQQREKASAKREREKVDGRSSGGKLRGRGKRVVRRIENASFSSNPHIIPPSRGDYYPPFPLHPHSTSTSTSFKSSLARSTPIPDVELPSRDPFSTSSRNGVFSTSLKGTRAMLRKRGRRVEVLITRVESNLRGWLGGDGLLSPSHDDDDDDDDDGRGGWREIDSTLVEPKLETQLAETSTAGTLIAAGATPRRTLPSQYRPEGSLPPLPWRPSRLLPAVLELSRSTAHVSWYVVEPFDRLVVHLLARYYELVSWSEDHLTSENQVIRLTHIIRPQLLRQRVQVPSHSLVTPDTSDHSAPPSSDSDRLSDTTSSGLFTETESDTDTETEGAGEDDKSSIQGYTVDAPIPVSGLAEEPGLASPTLESAIRDLDISQLTLERSTSHSLSHYASSEADSDYSMLGDSLDSLPPRPLPPPQGVSGGWVSTTFSRGDAPALSGRLAPTPLAKQTPGPTGGGGWDSKPSFFEYLYGE